MTLTERAAARIPGPITRLALVALAVSLLFPSAAFSQDGGTRIAPAPPRPIPRPVPPPAPRSGYEVQSVELTIDIADQRARVHLRQTVKNTGGGNLEIDCLIPLPADGAVSGLALVADGKELTGRVYPKDEAFGIYRKIVSEMRDPALLEFAGQGLFRARAFPVAKGASASLDLSLEYLLPKDDGRVDLDFPLANSLTLGKTVGLQDVSVSVAGRKVGGVLSLLEGVQITRTGDLSRATLRLEKAPALPRFRLHYREDAGPIGALTLSHKPSEGDDGFFLFMAEPTQSGPGREPMPKNVIFALDTSGSMAGAKFRQAQEALIFVLERLGPRDGFDLVTYSDGVSLWRPEIAPMNAANRDDAINHVRGLRATGSTNMEGALAGSLALNVGEGPAYLIFLTDGLPTVGETNELALAKLALAADKGRGVRIYTFGVGDDYNARLLDRLSGGSSGYSTFVAPGEDIEAKVASFYSKISEPVLVNPTLKASLGTNRVIPGKLPDVFRGSQLVAVGRYPKAGRATLTLSGKVGQDESVFTYGAEFAGGPTDGGQPIARLWAQRRIGQIIDEIDQSPDGEPNSDQLNELVELSKEFGVMTPYTSFLALGDEPLTDRARQAQRARQNLAGLRSVTGRSAIMQRDQKSSLAMSAAAAPAPMSASDEAASLSQMSYLDAAIGPGSEPIPPTIIDGQAFYLKDGRLVPGDMTEDDLKNLIAVKRFSPEYFDLAQRLSPGRLPRLTQAQPLAFKMDGKNYLIEDE
jgi:Ca-activated chloride channel family protein